MTAKVDAQAGVAKPIFSYRKYWAKRFGVAPPSIRTGDIYRGAIPFLVIQLFMVAMVLAFPAIVLVDAPPDASSVTDIPIEIDPESGFLPAEWR